MSATTPRWESKPASTLLDVRGDFPILEQSMNGKPLIYLDSGATTQKPRVVIEAMTRCYEQQYANIHRGNYQLSMETTQAYETARQKVADFLHVKDVGEILFTKGTTESINLVAHSLGRLLLKPGDEILISTLEHHSNIVPWQLACEIHGARLQVIPMNDAGELLLDEYRKLLTSRTRIVAVTHLSNALGTINDTEALARLAHEAGAVMVVDGAQWVAHHTTDIPRLDVDFYAFSGHKLYGPTGIGILYGKRHWLEKMPPYQGGGDMIKRVTFEKTTYADLPNKFEAGTPPIVEAVGLGAAIDYVSGIGMSRITQHEETLLKYLENHLQAVPGLRLVGTASRKSGAVSFVLEKPDIAAYDVGHRLDVDGIAVRTGHHCCQPLMDRLGINATVRASLGLYNRASDIDSLVESLLALRKEQEHKSLSLPLSTEMDDIFPKPFGPSPQAVAEELLEEFSLLEDWSDRYQYIMDLGNKLAPFPESERKEENRVHGCQATVYLKARKKPHSLDILDFHADANADIVRGLIAILQRLFSGQKSADILAFDIEGFLEKLGLHQNLQLTRRNGLASMIQRIRTLAHAIEASCVECAKC
ncbi:MAG TPA: SufS family cysteine desulfurase [Gemmatales bacterium]|nr:SufS family cysteine desulfurase [Gemmatales bacterium]